jgi:hypothetical protein
MNSTDLKLPTKLPDAYQAGAEAPVTPAQARANDPVFSEKNPVTAAWDKYHSPWDMANKDSPYSIGVSVGDWLKKPNIISEILDAGIAPGALGGALALGGLGLGGSLAHNMLAEKRKKTDAVRNAILLALVGAGAGGWLAFQRGQGTQKSGSSWSGHYASRQQTPAKQAVARMIELSPGLSHFEKTRYLAALSEASEPQVNALINALRLAGGAGIGAILARFLWGGGLARAGIGALLGGTAAALTNLGRRGSIWG